MKMTPESIPFVIFMFSLVNQKSLSNLYKSPSNRDYYILVSFGEKIYQFTHLFCGQCPSKREDNRDEKKKPC